MFDLTTIQLQNLIAGIVGPRRAIDPAMVKCASIATQRTAIYCGETYIEALEGTTADAGTTDGIEAQTAMRKLGYNPVL